MNDVTLKELKEEWSKFLVFEDDRVIDVVLGTVAANVFFKWDALNLFLVGPPGCGKTELANSLERVQGIYIIDVLSQNTFVSAYKEGPRAGQDFSLLTKLKKLGSKVLVIKDMSTILGKRSEVKKEIISQMRRISDGEIVMEKGNRMRVEWRGKLGFLALSTPALDAHYQDIAELGERWLYWRVDMPSKEKEKLAIAKAQENVGREDEYRGRLKDWTARFFINLSRKCPPYMDSSSEWARRITDLAWITAHLRSAVGRDSYTKQLQYVPIPEPGFRLNKQLTQLAIALAFVQGKKEVDDEVFALIRKVCRNCMHSFRYKILNCIWEHTEDREAELSIGEIAAFCKIPPNIVYTVVEELNLLGIIKTIMDKKSAYSVYKVALKDLAYKYIKSTKLLD